MPDSIDLLLPIFCDVFGDDEISLSRATTAQDIEGWDSMMHVNLIVKIEKTLGFKFKTSEIAKFKNVGDVADSVAAHLALK